MSAPLRQSAAVPPPPPYRPPHAPYLSVAHMDDEAIVVDKPAGLLSVPGRPAGGSDCVETRAAAAFGRAFIVHRLDLDTSGLILLARTKRAQRALSAQFAAREVAKTYYALVHGAPEANGGAIDLPLRCDWPNRPRQMVCHESGKPAVTEWEVAERRGDVTLMRLHPLTGRSHQLRVHMAEMGWPILGDPLYAAGAAADAPRMMLHAAWIEWRRADGSRRSAASPPPF